MIRSGDKTSLRTLTGIPDFGSDIGTSWEAVTRVSFDGRECYLTEMKERGSVSAGGGAVGEDSSSMEKRIERAERDGTREIAY